MQDFTLRTSLIEKIIPISQFSFALQLSLSLFVKKVPVSPRNIHRE